MWRLAASSHLNCVGSFLARSQNHACWLQPGAAVRGRHIVSVSASALHVLGERWQGVNIVLEERPMVAGLFLVSGEAKGLLLRSVCNFQVKIKPPPINIPTKVGQEIHDRVML